MQSHTASNPCSIAQYASVAALSGGEDFVENMKKTFDERRTYMVERANKMKGVVCAEPKGAFYLFMDVSALYGKSFEGEKIVGSMAFANAALKKGVALIPGIAFGDVQFHQVILRHIHGRHQRGARQAGKLYIRAELRDLS